ncbi:MAG TPA: choline ABC transporter permease subunit, partial [Aurantimonas sp.]|nr:choline ABC transporter permease subunit [Aurantimonas sp.]
MEWLEDNPLPIGDYAEAFVNWLTDNFTFVFDGLTTGLGSFIGSILFLLETPHPFVVVAVFCAIAWFARRSVPVVLFTLLGLLLIINLGFWRATTQTLALVLAATATSMVIGVPLGIAA